ncbi:MAG: hypothetical protein ABR974_14485 [Bacteroidales bacterium]|jgi:3-hydroxyacyl-[acyl-carrier-protein] dehydratase
MLLNRLYFIKQTSTGDDDSKFSFSIELNPSHEIFQGHFPGNPILPGVCTIEILRELLTNRFGHRLMLVRASSIKYLAVVNPVINSRLDFQITTKMTGNGMITCNTLVNSDSVILCRLSGEFKILN